MALTLRPVDGFSLRFEGAERVVRMVFDDIIFYVAALGTPLGPRFNIHVRHVLLSLDRFCSRNENYTKIRPPVALPTSGAERQNGYNFLRFVGANLA